MPPSSGVQNSRSDQEKHQVQEKEVNRINRINQSWILT